MTNPVFFRGKAVAEWRARIEASVIEAWRWWIGELAACVPPAMRQRFAGRHVDACC